LNKDLAWYYPEPKEAEKKIKNYVTFWKGVEVVTYTFARTSLP
jgi:uncharacterized protein (DUF427 family)